MLDRFVMIAALSLVLSAAPAMAQQQPRSGAAQPFATKDGNCPSGYYLSGSFCTPQSKDSHPAVPRPAGASCPTGYYTSGGACVKLNR